MLGAIQGLNKPMKIVLAQNQRPAQNRPNAGDSSR